MLSTFCVLAATALGAAGVAFFLACAIHAALPPYGLRDELQGFRRGFLAALLSFVALGLCLLLAPGGKGDVVKETHPLFDRLGLKMLRHELTYSRQGVVTETWEVRGDLARVLREYAALRDAGRDTHRCMPMTEGR